MQVFTNKYPILNNENLAIPYDTSKDSRVEVLFRTGKVFKMIGVTIHDVVLECEGVMIVVSSHMFDLLFTETELSFK